MGTDRERFQPSLRDRRYTLSHPHCDTTIIGTRNLAHLAENLEAAVRGPLPVKLSSEITARVAKATGHRSKPSPLSARTDDEPQSVSLSFLSFYGVHLDHFRIQ